MKEKKHNCGKCGRPINHRGNCFRCNIILKWRRNKENNKKIKDNSNKIIYKTENPHLQFNTKVEQAIIKFIKTGDKPSHPKNKNFDSEIKDKCKIKTKKGHYVQSKGEQLIADFLYNNLIDYDYDKQITLRGIEKIRKNHNTSWVRPDFYLTEHNIIIEYWGLKGSKEYDNNMEKKKRLYKESKTQFISITKEDLNDIDKLLSIKLKRLGCNL